MLYLLPKKTLHHRGYGRPGTAFNRVHLSYKKKNNPEQSRAMTCHPVRRRHWHQLSCLSLMTNHSCRVVIEEICKRDQDLCLIPFPVTTRGQCFTPGYSIHVEVEIYTPTKSHPRNVSQVTLTTLPINQSLSTFFLNQLHQSSKVIYHYFLTRLRFGAS